MLKTSKNDFLSELIIRSSTFVEKQTIVKWKLLTKNTIHSVILVRTYTNFVFEL